MKRIFFLFFILYSLFVASLMPAAAESQTWKVRPGDTLEIISTTLEIPKEEIKKHKRVKFADLASKMLGADGKPLPDIYVADNLHMNAKGYKIWKENLLPFLK